MPEGPVIRYADSSTVNDKGTGRVHSRVQLVPWEDVETTRPILKLFQSRDGHWTVMDRAGKFYRMTDILSWADTDGGWPVQ